MAKKSKYPAWLLENDAELTEEEEKEYEELSDYYASPEYERREIPPAASGTVLTGEAATASARVLFRRLTEGRPPLDPHAAVGEHARKRQVRLPGELDRQLDERARSEARSVSAILRDALREYLERHPAS